MLRTLAYYAAPLALCFLFVFPEVYRARPAGPRPATPAGLLVERTLLAGLGLLVGGALLNVLGQLKFRWAIPLFFLLPLYACVRLDRLGIDAARRRRLRAYAGLLVLTEALMVLGIVLQIHAGARVGLPARLNTPYDGVGGAAAAAGFRRGTIVAGPGPSAVTCGSRSRTRASRASRRRSTCRRSPRGMRARASSSGTGRAAARSRTISARGCACGSTWPGPGRLRSRR